MENPFFTALCLESNPIIDIQKTATAIGLSYNTVSKAVSILEGKEILIWVID